MPIEVLVTSLRTKWRFTDFWPEIEREIEKTLKGPVKTETTGMLGAVVADWKNTQQWRSQYSKIANGVELATYAAGPNRSIWQYVNEGTRPHKIPKSPRPAGDPLKFRIGYAPKTGTGGRFGGPGKATGGWRSARQVDHPGNAPRNFTGTIHEKYRTTYSRHIKRAVDRATKRVIRKA